MDQMFALEPVEKIIDTDSPVVVVAFNPDGTRVVSGSWDGTLRLWPTPKDCPDLLCAKITHNLSRKEWREQVSLNTEYQEQCPGLPIAPDAQAPQTSTVVKGERQ